MPDEKPQDQRPAEKLVTDNATISAGVAFKSLEARVTEMSDRLETARYWAMGAAVGLAAFTLAVSGFVWRELSSENKDLMGQEHNSQLTLVEVKAQVVSLNDQFKEANARAREMSATLGNIAVKVGAGPGEGGPYEQPASTPRRRHRHHR